MRLLALVVAAAQARAAVAADGVELVDEEDARAVLLRLLEHVAPAARAAAPEPLTEVGARDVEEGHACLAGDGPAEQGLAGPRRTAEQRALRNLAAQLLELRRVLEEIDDLGQLFLGFVDAGHVVEGHAVLVLG